MIVPGAVSVEGLAADRLANGGQGAGGRSWRVGGQGEGGGPRLSMSRRAAAV